MGPRRRRALALASCAIATVGSTADASDRPSLAPHVAVYDLALLRKSGDLLDGSARIASRLERKSCGRVDLDYRFVARSEREDATVVTDQLTVSIEDDDAGTFSFTTRTFVDNEPESVIRGTASTTGAGTKVEIVEPEPGTFDLPVSVFPSAHMRDLIDKASAGERIVETRLYDGDNEAGKMLTTTAVITAADDRSTAGTANRASNGLDGLDGLRRWRIDESFYNTDGAADGSALFRTIYTLYENGVSDDITIDTGDYAFAGSLFKLELGQAPQCADKP